MKTIRVTQLEKLVLEALADGMYAELGFSDMGIEEVAHATNLSHKVLRGVAGSLQKKGLISIDDREGEGYKNQTSMHIWYLTATTEGLVEHWVGQSEYNGRVVEKIILEEAI